MKLLIAQFMWAGAAALRLVLVPVCVVVIAYAHACQALERTAEAWEAA